MTNKNNPKINKTCKINATFTFLFIFIFRIEKSRTLKKFGL